ncbi:MAG: nucleotidyltransferase family protein [Armatimonas sp.]
MQDNSEFELLCWAVSNTLPPPSISTIDEEKIFLLAGQHRVIPRLLDRLEREPHPAISTSLKTRLRFARMMIERNMHHQLKQVQALGKLCDSPFVYIKGATVYALTGDRKTIRQSGDLDVLAADPEVLYEVMLQVGYTGNCKSGDYRGDTHEHSVLTGFGVMVEIHRCHFVHYGQIVGKRDDIPQRWSNICGVNPITYHDLSSYVVNRTVDGIENIPVLSPAAAAVMLCCHIGTNVVRVHAQHLKSTIGELADLADLIEHPDFVVSDFQFIIHKHKAEQIVALGIAMLSHFLGTRFLSIQKFDLGDTIDCCAPVDSNVCYGADLQEMLQPLSISERVNRLNKYRLLADGTWRKVPGDKYICYGSDCPELDASVTLSDKEMRIQFLWKIFPDEKDDIHIWYSSWLAQERNSILFKDKLWYYTEGVDNVTADTVEDGVLITIAIKDAGDLDDNPLLLILQHWHYDEEYYKNKQEKLVEPVIILPLEIVRGEH